MEQPAAAAQGSMAKQTETPDSLTVELNREIEDIRFAIDLLDGRDLLFAAEYTSLLCRLPLDEPIAKLSEGDLRQGTMNCVGTHASDLALLTIVHNLLDAIGRARANRTAALKRNASRRQNKTPGLKY